MAYDPKDPEDKKIVDGLIADALAEQADQHEQALTGLKNNNTRLKADLAKARKGEGGEDTAAEIERLSSELDKNKTDLAKAVKDLAKATKERDDFAKERDEANGSLTKTLVDGGLTEALVSANVPKHFLPAVKAMLAPQVSIKTEGADRRAVVGEKSLGDFIKEWSQGDEGKAYVAAAGNGGGGAQGPQGGSGNKPTMTRQAYEAAAPAERAAHFAAGGLLTDQ